MTLLTEKSALSAVVPPFVLTFSIAVITSLVIASSTKVVSSNCVSSPINQSLYVSIPVAPFSVPLGLHVKPKKETVDTSSMNVGVELSAWRRRVQNKVCFLTI